MGARHRRRGASSGTAPVYLSIRSRIVNRPYSPWMVTKMMDRSATSLSVARTMIEAWRRLDWMLVVNTFSEDGVLQIVPLPPYAGRPAIKAHLDQIASGIEKLDFTIKHLTAIGHTVYFERTDDFVYQGRAASVAVMGVMEIADGHVKGWREYMDLATMAKAMRG